MTFTGDLLVREKDGDFDACFENGQPLMTDGFESAVLLAVYGDKSTWQNGIASTNEEKYVSEFPLIIARAKVCEKTKKDGTEALKTALAFLTSTKAAQAVGVVGHILSAFAIGWQIDITAPDGTESKYVINWEKGQLTFGYRRAA